MEERLNEHTHDAGCLDQLISSWDQNVPFLNDNWFNSGLLAAIFFIFVAICILDRGCRKFIFHHLKTIASTVFLAGVALYVIGFNDMGSQNNLLTLLLRSSIASVEMFVSESELIEVKHSLHESPLYMTAFAITHFAAVFVSAIFILRLFGLKLLTRATLWLKRKMPRGKLYVFWDINPNTMAVADSIRKNSNDLLVFIKLPGEQHAHSSRFTFSHFFQTANSDIEPYMDHIENLKGLVMTANRKLSMDLVGNDGLAGFYRQLGLQSLGKTITKYEQVEFFFLSEDMNANIEAISTLKKQASLGKPEADKRFALPKDLHVYCHARRNHFTEGILSGKGLKYHIHLIDSSLLSVMQLKENGSNLTKYGRNHPVNFVDIDVSTGTVSSAFHALIIGFGETGQDAFRFLYEFSPFVKSVKPGPDGLDCITEQERKIYIIDRQLDRLKAAFLNDAPALKGSKAIEWLEGMNPESPSFWDKLHTFIDKLNYVVVTLDSDEFASTIAIRLFEFAYQYRKDMSKFRIYVRLHNENNKKILEDIGKYKLIHETDGEQKLTNGIEAFGTDHAIFSHDNILTISKEADAKDYYYQYSILSEEISSKPEEEKRQEIANIRSMGAEKKWKNRREKAIEQNTLEEETKITYQEEQDRSDVCHIYTKLMLVGALDAHNCFNLDRLEQMVKLTARNEKNEYYNALAGENKCLLNNLSYNEHLRWNAKMELLGFVWGPQKDFKLKTHPCIVDCNELIRNKKIQETLIYDTGVVELSFRKAQQQATALGKD